MRQNATRRSVGRKGHARSFELQRRDHLHGFTLIELLVVITIIVVLLALLTPALDQAVYQAELAACGAQVHVIITGTQQYALDFKRRYPDRPNLGEMQTIQVTIANQGWDLRPVVKGYFPINSLTCPLSGEVDIEGSKPETTFVFGSYDYWAGWRYHADPGASGMARMGDRFTSADDADPSRRHSFNLLVSDRDVIGIDAQVQSTHPDHDGVLRQLVLQDAENYAWGAAGGKVAYGTITIAMWRLANDHSRGPVDRNFGYQDGAVLRMSDLIVKPRGQQDERLVTAPVWTNGKGYAGSSAGASGAYYTTLPRE